jgi:hypothetical protein
MHPLQILKIPNTEWCEVNINGHLYGTSIPVNTVTCVSDSDLSTNIIWLKHKGDCRLHPVSTIYNGTVLNGIPTEWIPLINQKRIHIVIDTMEESWGPVYKNTINHVESIDLHTMLETNANELGIDCSQITWLTGDMNAEEYCKDSNVNVKSVCMFLWSFANIIGTIDDVDTKAPSNIDNFIICPNRFPKAHRGYTVSRLKKMQEQNNEHAFNQIRYSFPKEIDGLSASTIIDAYNKLTYRKEQWPDYFDRNNTFDWDDIKRHMYELHDILPRKLDDVDFNTDYCSGIDAIDSISEYYHKSAICLVTETWAEGRKLFISDAVLAPILNRTPFLLIGCRGSLDFLQRRGFKTFGDILDEDYDDIEDDAERWDSVLTQVEKLGKTQTIFSIKEQLSEILDYNFNHMFDIAPQEEQLFETFLRGLV